nr:hypothetical protein [Allomuricauda sp.]
MDLTTLMKLLEGLYNGEGGKLKVLIGEEDGRTRDVNDIQFNKDSQTLIIY